MTLPRFPHALVLLFVGILLAASLTWIVPAGVYERRDDPATGQSVVIAGTYHPVDQQPVSLFEAFVAIPKGLVKAADVVFFVFLVGGAFTVVDKTGALRQAVDWLAVRLAGRRGLVVPVVCVVFATGGALENLQEEIIAMVPVLLLLCRRLGFEPLTAVAMSIGAASVGSAFSPVNPFQAVLAMRLAQLAPSAGLMFRVAFLGVAVALWIWATARLAGRSPGTVSAAGAPESSADVDLSEYQLPQSRRTAFILLLVAIAFAAFIVGVMRWHWGMTELAAVFFIMGMVAGLAGGLGPNGTAMAFVEGFQSMAFAAMLIGFARAIFVVLDDGHVVDTIVSALFAPLAHWPVAASAVGMMGVQTLLHPAIPSVVGQAVLTMPVLVPLADLLGLSRQVVVLAYQYGAGLCELLIPTNGALMAILGAAQVRFEDWLRFVVPVYLLLAALGIVAILGAVATGLR